MTIINKRELNNTSNIRHRLSVSSLLPSQYGAKKYYLNLNVFYLQKIILTH